MGRPKNPPKAREMLKNIIPVEELFDETELPIYEALVDIYLKDFDNEDLSSGDMDDVMVLAMNRVMEIRLLRTSKGDATAQIDISATIEKLRKQNDKIKESLSSRRRDRIDPSRIKGMSIVDFAVAFEEDKKKQLQDRLEVSSVEELEALKKREEYVGNRYDPDADVTRGGNDD